MLGPLRRWMNGRKANHLCVHIETPTTDSMVELHGVNTQLITWAQTNNGRATKLKTASNADSDKSVSVVASALASLQTISY